MAPADITAVYFLFVGFLFGCLFGAGIIVAIKYPDQFWRAD